MEEEEKTNPGGEQEKKYQGGWAQPERRWWGRAGA